MALAAERPRVVSWGEVLWDLYPEGRRLGGAPSNVAYHLAAQGGDVALVSRVGDDEPGRAAREALAGAGVDVAAVAVDGAHPTGAVGVTIEAGEARYQLRSGCAWEFIEWDAAAAAQVAEARALCFGSLAERRREAREALGQALAARPGDCLAVCDLNLRPGEQDRELVAWALGVADVVKINEREEGQIGELLGVPAGCVVSWLLEERGAGLVALTRGAAGCTLFGASGRIDQAGFPAAPGGDNVGCGDAFTAVLVHHLVRGGALELAAAAACRYAAQVASYRGATPQALGRGAGGGAPLH